MEDAGPGVTPCSRPPLGLEGRPDPFTTAWVEGQYERGGAQRQREIWGMCVPSSTPEVSWKG